MLLSVKGVGQVVITPNYSTNYNGFPTQPPFTITGCCGEVKLFTDNSTGNSIGTNAPINAGSYKLRITFTFGPNNTFFDEQNFTINKATPTLSVTNSPLTYTGSALNAAISNTVPGDISNINYNGSATVPTNAGTYAITADFAPTDAVNYNSLTGVSAGNFVINKATPTLSVTNPTLTYTANTQSATLSSSVAGNFPTAIKYNGSTTIPTNAGTYTITTDFVPNEISNYNSLTNEIAGSLIINKAPITISNIIVTKVYDGTPTVSLISNESTGSLLEDNIVGVAAPTNFSNKIVANNYSLTVTFSLTSATGKESNYYILGGNQKSISNGE